MAPSSTSNMIDVPLHHLSSTASHAPSHPAHAGYITSMPIPGQPGEFIRPNSIRSTRDDALDPDVDIKSSAPFEGDEKHLSATSGAALETDSKIEIEAESDGLSPPQRKRLAAGGSMPDWISEKQEMGMFLTTCVSMFVVGWGDGSSGPLIPSLQDHYEVNYVLISLIFIISVIGFIGAALLNVWVTDKFGFGKVMVFAAGLQTLGYAMNSWSPPFGVFVTMFAIITAGAAWQDAQANAIVNRFTNPDAKMSILHAAYGLGAAIAPLVATLFVSHVPKFYTFYGVSAGLGGVNVCIQAYMWRFKRAEEILGPAPGDEEHEGKTSGGKMKELLKKPLVHLLGFFLFFYVGMEVAIGGWIVSFVQQRRGGGASSGYVSSGYWGGLTVGRVILIPVNKWLGDIWAIYVYMTLAIACEIVVWFVPSLVANGVAISLVGIFLGPQYPIVMRVCGKMFDASIVTGVIGWASSFGAAGGATWPFVAGALSEKFGINAIQPFIVALMAGCIVMWIPVPKKPRVAVNSEEKGVAMEKD